MLFLQDLHLHLYGCLSANDVWQIGRDRYLHRLPLMDWYAEEYQKAWGRKPDYHQYWDSPDGLSLLQQDFEFKTPGDFAQFQACFNLAVAAVGLFPDDTQVLRAVVANLLRWQTRYAELRTVIPLRLTPAETDTYLTTLCTEALSTEQTSGLVLKLIFSLERDHPLYETQYQRIKDWKAANPPLGRIIHGIDFCGAEETHPPMEKAEFFARVLRDNEKAPDQALRIYYHVGETFRQISLASSIRWVYQAHQLGVHRLGHATSLAIDPRALLSQQVHEPIQESHDHYRWLMTQHGTLKEFGFERSLSEIQKEWDICEKAYRTSPTGTHELTYTPDTCAELAHLQQAVRNYLKHQGAVIESCPTSNLRLAPIMDLAHHPLHAFAKDNFPVCIASDDPGIFCTTISEELRFCREQLNLPESYLNAEVHRE